MALTSKKARQMGRKSSRKGVPNTSTKEIRENFALLISDNIEQLKSDLASLEPKDRINAIVDLAKFVIPTLRSADVNAKATFTPDIKQITGMTIK